MNKQDILITKHSGDLEPFLRQKLLNSLERAGAPKDLAEDIAKVIETKLYDGMTTKEIYQLAFSLLQKAKKSLAARFSLKKAIFQLGPEGYPFEKFVGKILERQGYKVQVGQIVQGKCVNHEVDVIAEKEDKHFLLECKFHNQQGIKSDVKVALYVKARFDDIQALSHAEHKTVFHQAWLVTNTKFTQDAVQYAKCAGMNLVGWNYPKKGNLQDLIEKVGLHPLTCLTSLSLAQKRMLLKEGIVLCQEIIENKDLLSKVGIKNAQQNQILNEIKQVCF